MNKATITILAVLILTAPAMAQEYGKVFTTVDILQSDLPNPDQTKEDDKTFEGAARALLRENLSKMLTYMQKTDPNRQNGLYPQDMAFAELQISLLDHIPSNGPAKHIIVTADEIKVILESDKVLIFKVSELASSWKAMDATKSPAQ